MRNAAILCLLLAPATAWASSESDAAKAFIKSVNKGENLETAYPGVVTKREAASLARVRNCSANNLMKQPSGEYTVVWQCSGGALGMRMEMIDGKLSTVQTFEVVRRPNTAS
jgi:hypothetical protein